MVDRQKLADAKDWAEGQRKGAPNWYGLTLLDALTECQDKNKRLWLALDDALKMFKITQNPGDYSKDHWSNRAQAALQENRE